MSIKIQDFFLTCKECILENPRSFYGSFSLGPFSNSQSLTVANALRRTLLAEIHNLSITHLEIYNIAHEYTVCEGIRESMVDLVLNFKQIILQTSESLHHPLYGYLSVRGPGIIRASDLKLPPCISLVDPDQYLATLSENGNIKIRFRISTYEYDKNFASFNSQNFEMKSFSNFLSGKKEKNATFQSQKIWIDPQFNPILKVNYLIQRIEPFQKDTFSQFLPHPESFLSKKIEKVTLVSKIEDERKNEPMEVIFLEIWTNGSLHPRQALYKSLKYLKKMFFNLEQMELIKYQFLETAIQSEQVTTKFLKGFEYDYQRYEYKEQNHKIKPNEILAETDPTQFSKNFFSEIFQTSDECQEKSQILALQKLKFPNRILRCLEKNHIFTLNDLLKYSSDELKTFPGLGNYSIYTIQKILNQFNLTLKKN